MPSTAEPTTPATEDDLAKLRQQVERDFLRNEDLLWTIAQNPKVKNLERRLGQALIPGSPRFKAQVEVFRGMAATNERMVLGEPPIRKRTVERIEFVGAEPFSEAVVTSCDVDNAARVAEGRSGGTVFVQDPPVVRAFRVESVIRLTNEGWKEYGDDVATNYWEGAKECPES